MLLFIYLFCYVHTHQLHTEILLTVRKAWSWVRTLAARAAELGQSHQVGHAAISDEEARVLPGPAAAAPGLAAPGGTPGLWLLFYTCLFCGAAPDRPCSSPHPCPGSSREGAGAACTWRYLSEDPISSTSTWCTGRGASSAEKARLLHWRDARATRNLAVPRQGLPVSRSC